MPKKPTHTNTSLSALNEYLFQQLEVLTNPDLEGDELKEEIKRSKAITDVASCIVDNARTALAAAKVNEEYLSGSYDNNMFMLPEGGYEDLE